MFKVPKGKEELFFELCKKWSSYFEIGYELATVDKIVFSSVNSYLSMKEYEEFDKTKETYKEYLNRQIKSDNIKQKNEFSTKRPLEKSSSNRALSYGLNAYYLNNMDLDELFNEHLDVLDFCIDQKVGDKFQCIYKYEKEGLLYESPLQKVNRFYCSNKGGILLKRKFEYDPKEEKQIKKETKLLADSLINIFNDYEKINNINDYNINLKWYKLKIKSIIKTIDLEISKKNKKNKTINLQKTLF